MKLSRMNLSSVPADILHSNNSGEHLDQKRSLHYTSKDAMDPRLVDSASSFADKDREGLEQRMQEAFDNDKIPPEISENKNDLNLDSELGEDEQNILIQFQQEEMRESVTESNFANDNFVNDDDINEEERESQQPVVEVMVKQEPLSATAKEKDKKTLGEQINYLAKHKQMTVVIPSMSK